MKKEVAIFWFRRDLRLSDNAGFWKALKSGYPVLPIFIFDKAILDRLEDKDDARVSFIHKALSDLDGSLKLLGSGIQFFYGSPLASMEELNESYNIKAVYLNRDYEPYARQRDKGVQKYWEFKNVPVFGAKDHVIFEKNEVVKADGSPYLVYSPYAKAWRNKLTDYHIKSYPTEAYLNNLLVWEGMNIPTLEEMGFVQTKVELPELAIDRGIISTYDSTRDFPGNKKGTTHLGLHLRFGTLSIRELAKKAVSWNDTFLSELIWRDFFQMALYYFPESREKAIKQKYDAIIWENNEEHFAAWCKGRTGYPIVDAGMRELNATGYMHNRVRMIVASFLTKHLLIDWRWGEAYFAQKLLDFDLASNIGGWQWASGSGLDAAPYFRVFNPTAQMEKFDKDLKYIRRWVPELDTNLYPKPIVEHKWARERCLSRFKDALSY
jgi:deoxyribodipyrimidine photo-lyase